jgi:hypothetical protein
MYQLLLIALLSITSSYSMIVPENDLQIFVGDKAANNMTQEEFNQVIDSVENTYAPIVRELGGTLFVDRRWSNPTVNAYATRTGPGGKTWKVAMFGGLARHSTITKDAFAAVVCHEIGHLMGGMPRYAQNRNHMSTEGQADYFAMNKCLKRTWTNDTFTTDAPKYVQDQCKTHKTEKAYKICLRSSMESLN